MKKHKAPAKKILVHTATGKPIPFEVEHAEGILRIQKLNGFNDWIEINDDDNSNTGDSPGQSPEGTTEPGTGG
jgi:hypothetical protein